MAPAERNRKMILDQFKLDGKVAIVTGAGRGIGQAYALGLAEAGADIILPSMEALYGAVPDILASLK